MKSPKNESAKKMPENENIQSPKNEAPKNESTKENPPLDSDHYGAEVAMDPECRSRLRQDSSFFFRTRSKKFVKNRIRIRSHFSLSAVAGVCVVIT